MAFWSEWKDDLFALNLTKMLVVLLTGIAIFLIVNADLQDNTIIMAYLILSGMLVLFVAQTEKERAGELIHGNFFGDKKKTQAFLIVGVVLGTILGLSSRGGGLSLVLPVQALYLGDLRFFLVNIVAPLLEPPFWRGVLFPMALAFFVGIFGKGANRFGLALGAALLLSAFTFGIYHIGTYFGQSGSFTGTYEIMAMAVLFGVIFIITNQLAGTIALEVGWHFANNMFTCSSYSGTACQAFTYSTAEIISTTLLWLVGMFLLIEIASRISKR